MQTMDGPITNGVLQKLWQEALDDLRSRVNAFNHQTLIDHACPIRLSGDTVIFESPSPEVFVHLVGPMESALTTVSGRRLRVEFVPTDDESTDDEPAGTEVLQFPTRVDAVETETPAEDAWEPPAPFMDRELAPFPVEALPEWLRSFVIAEAAATQTPVDLAGMLSLAAISTAVARKARVEIGSWIEPLNLYVVSILPSGNRKSRVLMDMAAPIVEHERRQIDKLGPFVAEQQSTLRIKQKRLDDLEKSAAGAGIADKKATEEAALLAREIYQLKSLATPQWIIDDCTPEKVASLLSEQNGRIAVWSAEGNIFDMMTGKYSKQANFGVFLYGHTGEDWRSHRMGRQGEFISGPAITMGIAIQPYVVQGLAGTPGLRHQGLLGRILYSWPRSMVGHRSIDPPPMPKKVQAAYGVFMQKLLDLPFRTGKGRKTGLTDPYPLRLNDDAKKSMKEFEGWLEPQMEIDAPFATMVDWAGKLAGAVLRIAGLLHLATYCYEEEPWTRPIEHATIESAITIGRYLIPHAQTTFDQIGVDPDIERAQTMVRMIKRHKAASFSKRELFHWVRGHTIFNCVEDLARPLRLLIEQGHIREQRCSAGGRGRPAGPSYETNPALLEEPNKGSKEPSSNH